MTEDEAQRGGAIGCAVLVVLVILVLGAVAVLAWNSQQDRLKRIENAEERYGATYLRNSKNGEGGGVWRLPGDVTDTCSVSGDVDEPTLSCSSVAPVPSG